MKSSAVPRSPRKPASAARKIRNGNSEKNAVNAMYPESSRPSSSIARRHAAR
jgi:hypothetical protein